MIWPQCCVLENSHLPPRGGFTPQKMLLLAKMFLLSLYFQNRVSDFDDFCTDVIGLSALAEGPMDWRSCVRSCVRPRRDIWRSAHQIFLKLCPKLHLSETKKCSKRIFEKNSRFQDLAKNGQFLPYLAIFSRKIRFLDIFFEFAHQICLKLGQKLGTVAMNQGQCCV